MVPICKGCGIDYLDRTDHSNCDDSGEAMTEYAEGGWIDGPPPVPEYDAHVLCTYRVSRAQMRQLGRPLIDEINRLLHRTTEED
jgi:hypothetical protein